MRGVAFRLAPQIDATKKSPTHSQLTSTSPHDQTQHNPSEPNHSADYTDTFFQTRHSSEKACPHAPHAAHNAPWRDTQVSLFSMSGKQLRRGQRCGYRHRDRRVFDVCQGMGRFRADAFCLGRRLFGLHRLRLGALSLRQDALGSRPGSSYRGPPRCRRHDIGRGQCGNVLRQRDWILAAPLAGHRRRRPLCPRGCPERRGGQGGAGHREAAEEARRVHPPRSLRGFTASG